jgi:hypothetical protein
METVPWKLAKELYTTIDSIQDGIAPWSTYTFTYNGPKPAGSVPAWMTETYELNAWNVLHVLESQLADRDFNGLCDYIPYKEFDPQGNQVWSNLLSGEWAYREAVSSWFSCLFSLDTYFFQDKITKLPGTRGSMLVLVIAGSDKTTVSVATVSQEYHPVYVSPGNITNAARRSHGIGVLPFAFLPIPKRMIPSPTQHFAKVDHRKMSS